jgi:hypothetical protein
MKLPDEERSPNTTEGVILAADWGMEAGKRTVYAAEVSSRVVRRVLPNKPWTLAGVLDVAMSMAATGSVVAVPESFLNVAAAIPLWRSPSNFVDLLSRACERPLFFAGTTDASQWAIERPFFSVPAGGGLKNYIAAAAGHRVDLYRDIDRRTGGKSAFIKSGVPGSVGSAACALWQEIGPLLDRGRAFRMWPFEGELPVLRASAPVVLAEIYPRSAKLNQLSIDLGPSASPIRSGRTPPAGKQLQRFGEALGVSGPPDCAMFTAPMFQLPNTCASTP